MMVNFKDIQRAILEKTKGLNADVQTLIRIAKENGKKERQDKEEQVKREEEFKRGMEEVGIRIL